MADDYQDLIKVREVTDIHSNWSDHGSGEPGKFSFQLILDDGAEEAVIRPTPEDSDVMLAMLEASRSIFFDEDRRVVVFGSLALGGAAKS
ncbi:hypothetical protein [Haloactinomyces albus]|uniref:Uncharacterized protein n=1 Tax=Haloactinomyces albus TaxID=1352928 RepID=A0AAE3ZFR4_9ACTN|nr:hypothetical protein [Haloactinomyces albus]MDR7302189.1 hypothetical protein [Haloactinomyces albus]